MTPSLCHLAAEIHLGRERDHYRLPWCPNIIEWRCDEFIRLPLIVTRDESDFAPVGEPANQYKSVIRVGDHQREAGVEIPADHTEDAGVPETRWLRRSLRIQRGGRGCHSRNFRHPRQAVKKGRLTRRVKDGLYLRER